MVIHNLWGGVREGRTSDPAKAWPREFVPRVRTPRVAGHGLEGMKRGSITPCRLEGYSYPRNASISMFESGIFKSRSNRSVPTTMLGVPVT